MLQRIESTRTRSRARICWKSEMSVRELDLNAGGQYLLTEVLLLEHVDRLIARRLRLPSFPRWRARHRTLRLSQREPTHWGLEQDAPLIALTRRFEPGDLAVVIGAAALPSALYLAAHDAEVFLLDQDLGAIEAAESRAVSEQLAGRFHALVIQFGNWLPDIAPSLVVLDPAALAVQAQGARERAQRPQDAHPARVVHLFFPPPPYMQ